MRILVLDGMVMRCLGRCKELESREIPKRVERDIEHEYCLQMFHILYTAT